jgi:hypothetical protein
VKFRLDVLWMCGLLMCCTPAVKTQLLYLFISLRYMFPSHVFFFRFCYVS